MIVHSLNSNANTDKDEIKTSKDEYSEEETEKSTELLNKKKNRK